MKQYIKSLALLLVAGLALTSCNDNFDEDEGHVTYPARPSLGAWECEYVNSQTPYTDFNISLTQNAEGDTICNLTFYWGGDTPFGWISFHDGEVSYDPTTGMTHVYFDPSSQGITADLYMAYQRNLRDMGVQFTMQGNPTLAFRATPASEPGLAGQWSGQTTTGDALSLNFEPIDSTCTVNLTCADPAAEGITRATGTYVVENGKGVITVPVTAADGSETTRTIALALNGQYQLTATTDNGLSFIMLR